MGLRPTDWNEDTQPVIPSIHSLSAAYNRQKLDESGLRNVIDST